MGLRPLEICLVLQREDRPSESEVYIRQSLTTKVDSRTLKVNPVRAGILTSKYDPRTQ